MPRAPGQERANNRRKQVDRIITSETTDKEALAESADSSRVLDLSWEKAGEAAGDVWLDHRWVYKNRRTRGSEIAAAMPAAAAYCQI